MTVATSTLLGRPLWYELMTSDMKASEAFYLYGRRLEDVAIRRRGPALYDVQSQQ